MWIVFAFAITGHAQVKGDVVFGVHSGLNIATNDGLDGLHFGMNVGVSFDCYLSDRWSVKAKLLYDPKGWEKSHFSSRNTLYFSVINSENIKYDLDYLTIPVTAGLHFGKRRNGYIHMGPYVGLLIDSEKTKSKHNYKVGFYDFDWGINLGLGFEVPILDATKLFFEYDTQAGVSNVVKNGGYTIANLRAAFNVGVKMMIE